MPALDPQHRSQCQATIHSDVLVPAVYCCVLASRWQFYVLITDHAWLPLTVMIHPSIASNAVSLSPHPLPLCKAQMLLRVHKHCPPWCPPAPQVSGSTHSPGHVMRSVLHRSICTVGVHFGLAAPANQCLALCSRQDRDSSR